MTRARDNADLPIAITESAGNVSASGNLTVDTNTLHVNASNNRVGIGTLTPADHLAVVTSGANAQLSVDRSDGAAGRTVLIHSTAGGQLQTTGAAPLIFGTADTERMRINDSGYITKPNQVCFVATGNNGNYINTTPIPFPNVITNIGNGYNNSNYTFTAPIAGRYFFHFHMGVTAGHNTNAVYPWFNVNGSNIVYTYHAINASTVHSNTHLTQIFPLGANDTVKVTFSGSGTYYNNAAECRFMGYLLG